MTDPRKSPGSRANAARAITSQDRAKFTARHATTEADFVIEGDAHLIPPGTYEVCFDRWWTGTMFGRQPKLALLFKIVTPGEHFGKQIARWYNVRAHIGKPGVSGRFKVARHSDFVQDYARLLGLPSRLDRFALTHLRSLVLSVEVGTVERNRKQVSIAEPLRYSVIRHLRGVECGSIEQSNCA